MYIFTLNNHKKLKVFKRCGFFSDTKKTPKDRQKRGKVKQEPVIMLSSKTCRKGIKLYIIINKGKFS